MKKIVLTSVVFLSLLTSVGCSKHKEDAKITEPVTTEQTTQDNTKLYKEAGLLTFRNEKQLELGELDSKSRATYAHIQLKDSDEPKEKREAQLTFDPVGWHNYKFYYGDGTKEAWLMNRGHLVGYQFSQKLDVIDPISRMITKEPVKQFMVNQLKLSFERDRIALCPYDEHIYRQLVNYTIERYSSDGKAIFTSKDEHFIDALGLAHLAFVLKFPEVAQAIEGIKSNFSVTMTENPLDTRFKMRMKRIEEMNDAWKQRDTQYKQIGKGPGERRGDYQKWVSVPLGSGKSNRSSGGSSWGARGGNSPGRKMW